MNFNKLSDIDVLYLAALCGIVPEFGPGGDGRFAPRTVRKQVAENPAFLAAAESLLALRAAQEDALAKAQAQAIRDAANRDAFMDSCRYGASNYCKRIDYGAHSKRYQLQADNMTGAQVRMLTDFMKSRSWVDAGQPS